MYLLYTLLVHVDLISPKSLNTQLWNELFKDPLRSYLINKVNCEMMIEAPLFVIRPSWRDCHYSFLQHSGKITLVYWKSHSFDLAVLWNEIEYLPGISTRFNFFSVEVGGKVQLPVKSAPCCSRCFSVILTKHLTFGLTFSKWKTTRVLK